MHLLVFRKAPAAAQPLVQSRSMHREHGKVWFCWLEGTDGEIL